MADKEATVFIVDLGRSMKERRHGREKSDLEWALSYVRDRITSTMALDRKTTFQAIIGLKTDDTQNELDVDLSFSNIYVFQELSQIFLSDLRSLDEKLVPSETEKGDAISAIVVAIQMIEKKCRRLKYIRRIVLVTDGRGALDVDQVSEITAKIKDEGIELTVLGVDFDDDEYDYHEEAKGPYKAKNESILRSLVESCGGMFGTLAQAVDEMAIPRIKAVKPVPSYRKDLVIGDGRPEVVEDGEPEDEKQFEAITIQVERYPRVAIRAAPSASSYVVRPAAADGTDAAPSSATLAAYQNGDVADQDTLTHLKTERMYEIKDPEAEGGKREVPQSKLKKGYEYGRSAVHIDESAASEARVLDLKTHESLQILGFIPWSNFDRYMGMSTTNIIIGSPKNSKAIMALSSVIHALNELESFAIGRFVRKDDSGPVMLLLAPSIEPDYECLIDIQLPFAEDVRQYRFPPLDRVVTVSGKVLREHRFLPTDQLQQAMDAYVDSMDLEKLRADDDDTEYASIYDIYSPMVHRIDQVVRHRAAHPEDQIPEPNPILLKYSKPPTKLVEASSAKLAHLKKVAEVQKVDPKEKARKGDSGKAKPISGLDVVSMIPEREHISDDWAISDFKHKIYNPRPGDYDAIHTAAQQLGDIIEKSFRQRFGGVNLEQQVERMGAFREGMVKLDEAHEWNDWARGFKRKLLQDELGGDGKNIWWELLGKRLGLITPKDGASHSKASEDEARAFLSFNSN